jgi:hypothetical protein
MYLLSEKHPWFSLPVHRTVQQRPSAWLVLAVCHLKHSAQSANNDFVH